MQDKWFIHGNTWAHLWPFLESEFQAFLKPWFLLYSVPGGHPDVSGISFPKSTGQVTRRRGIGSRGLCVPGVVSHLRELLKGLGGSLNQSFKPFR